jgi:hypothetical protein
VSFHNWIINHRRAREDGIWNEKQLKGKTLILLKAMYLSVFLYIV